ncbi:MAG TPA: DUF4136 domain-containing protein [Cyclobacteriaceae bacterium]|nr:DUF4136 domain-containing protein [Cyclobacteriaceae bacterium]
MRSIYILMGALAMLTASCSIKVHSTYDRHVDFSKYKTFCWLNGCEFTYTGPTYLNDSLLREKIKEPIVAEMNAKGFTEDNNNPDLLIDFHISVKNESSIIYHRGDDNIYEFKPFPDQEVINYLKGTIVIHMVDKSEGRMVWRSEAIGYMDVHPDLSERNIRKGIAIALKKFPPKPYQEGS